MKPRSTTLDERCAAMRVRLDTEAANRNKLQAMTEELREVELLIEVAERQFEDATEAAAEATEAAQRSIDAQSMAKQVMTKAKTSISHLTTEIDRLKRHLRL